MQYRRAFIPGGSYFFTVVTAQRRPLLASDASVELIREAIRRVRIRRPFSVDAMVILPDHLHCIWTLPEGDCDFPTRWRLVKTWFTKHLPCPPLRTSTGSRRRRGQQDIWQPRYWEHLLRNEQDVVGHMDYIHYNPVKHGLVNSPWAWPYSSFRYYVKTGRYAREWGSAGIEFEGIGNE